MTRSIVIVAVLIGCGGKVVFVEDGGEGAAGGNGNGAATNGGAPTTGSNPSTDVGPTVNTTISTNDTSVVTVGTGGQGGHGSFCELGRIPAECEACTEEAFRGQCSEPSAACVAVEECVSYAECIFDCFNEPDCCANCELEVPEGAKLYSDLVFCLMCEACPGICDPAARVSANDRRSAMQR